jgi:flagellar export protein FliJ
LGELKHFGQQRETVLGEVARRRELLVEADREVKILEKLREKQAQRRLQDDDLQEMKRLDEVAGQRHTAEEVT